MKAVEVRTKYHNEMLPTLHDDLDERITGHILDSLMAFVHELEQLVDDRLEKLPVDAQEPRILTNDVHDVRSNHRLVVFSCLLLAKAKEI